MAVKLCPLIRKPCLEHGCEFYQPINYSIGTRNGPIETKFDCLFKHLLPLVKDVIVTQEGTQKSVEEWRNVTVQQMIETREAVTKSVETLVGTALELDEKIEALDDKHNGAEPKLIS